MREALRRRIGEVGITLETLEELSGATTRGYATKILGEPPLKRAQLETFLWLIEALGLELILRINPQTAAKMAPRYIKRKLARVVRPGDASPIGDFFQRLSRLGNEARSRELSPERRSELARHAANARWSKSGARRETRPAQAAAGGVGSHTLRKCTSNGGNHPDCHGTGGAL
jgi:hypothetical protein